MYEELAVKIFAAENGIEDEARAKEVMYQYGFADKYLTRANKLEPVFQQAYQDGQLRGVEIIQSLVNDIGLGSPPTPDVAFGADSALNAVKTVLKVALEEMNKHFNIDTDKVDPINDLVKMLKGLGIDARVAPSR